MISRRNIRVKVMQTLYNVETAASEIPAEPAKILNRHFQQSQSLLIYLTWFLTQVARYAEKEAHKRASKHLPTPEDLNVNTKLAGNTILWRILEDPNFDNLLKKEKPELRTDDELIRKIYQSLVEKEEYKTYIAEQSRDNNAEKQILLFILNDLLLDNETFIHHLEELFSNWDDDGEMIVQIVLAKIQKPGSQNFEEIISPDKESFAKNLLETTLEKKEHLQSFIIPKLKNWDPERIAMLDMVLMRMGVAEFLYFETIPPKVTINEYIDIAKEYSTQQSGQFINGILDNINKDLQQQGKMLKTDYKKNGLPANKK